jgi:hypothetical protein
MRASDRSHVLAIAFSLGLHAAVFALVSGYQFGFRTTQKAPPKSQIVFMQVLPQQQEQVPSKDQELSPVVEPLLEKTPAITEATDSREKTPPTKEPAPWLLHLHPRLTNGPLQANTPTKTARVTATAGGNRFEA